MATIQFRLYYCSMCKRKNVLENGLNNITLTRAVEKKFLMILEVSMVFFLQMLPICF